MESQTPRECGCMNYGIGEEFIGELVDHLKNRGQASICGIGGVSWDKPRERLVINLAPDFQRKLEREDE